MWHMCASATTANIRLSTIQFDSDRRVLLSTAEHDTFNSRRVCLFTQSMKYILDSYLTVVIWNDSIRMSISHMTIRQLHRLRTTWLLCKWMHINVYICFAAMWAITRYRLSMMNYFDAWHRCSHSHYLSRRMLNDDVPAATQHGSHRRTRTIRWHAKRRRIHVIDWTVR